MNETLTFSPHAPYHLLTTGFALALLLVTLAGLITRRIRSIQSIGVMLLGILALATWAIAVWNPVRVRNVDQSARHLAVVWDVSDSTGRAEGGWRTVQRRAADFVEAAVDSMSDDVRRDAAASLTTFRGSAVSQRMPITELSDALRQLDRSRFAGGTGSDIGLGLERSAEQITEAGGTGEVLLITDGHDTVGQALQAANRLAQRGIPITVLPVDSREPAVAISALNLTTQTAARAETFLRGSVRNHSIEDASTQVEVTRYNADGESQSTGADVPSLNPDTYARLRLPMTFEGVGLQAVDVQLQSGQIEHHRRLYTHVTRPLQLLAVGGDLRWTAAITPDVAEIDTIPPDQLTSATDLSQYDSLVISDAPAESLGADVLPEIARAVERDGLGLFMINGNHGGADEQAETMLRSYADTEVDPLLPVTTDPRPYQPEPPPRQVVFFIDTSGSMSGWKVNKAKEVATYVIENLLRPEDTIDIVAFTTGAAVPIEQRRMDAAGKRDAVNAVQGLQAGGGTDPREALALIRDRRMNNCGLIFLSDGYFSSGIAEARPDCRATVFGIGRTNIASNDPLFELADPFEVSQQFNPANIEIPYFEPEERDKFFERGGYTPLSMGFIDPNVTLPVPDLRLQGTAVSYMRDDAQRVATRPKYLDPVLAYRDSGLGRTGVLTTAFPQSWLDAEAGRDAIQQYVLDVVGYKERERYLFDVNNDGATLSMQIMVRDRDDTPPQLDLLTAAVSVDDDTFPMTVRPVSGEPATYKATANLPHTEDLKSAQLIIEEFGPDAVSRAQRVPLALPPAADTEQEDTTEANSYGTNTSLLQSITTQTGGTYAPEPGHTFFTQSIEQSVLDSYWHWLLGMGAILFLAAIAVQKA